MEVDTLGILTGMGDVVLDKATLQSSLTRRPVSENSIRVRGLGPKKKP